MLSETKIDDSFPKGQFLIKGFGDPFRIETNVNRGGILFYVREDIPAKLLSVETLPTESFYVEINLRKKKWLVSCSYNLPRDNISNHLQTISKSLDLHLSQYDNIIVGDFNTEIGENSMNAFCERYSLSSLINEPTTCYKNPANPSYIDLILTNLPRSFQNSNVVETGLSDLHRIIVTENHISEVATENKKL